MGLREDFEAIVAGIPYSLREEVIGYVDSVEESSPEIFREAGVDRSPELLDQFLFLAGVRRLHTLTTSYYWLLDRSLQLLGSDASAISVGRSRLERGGGEMKMLRDLVRKFNEMLANHGLSDVVAQGSLADVVLFLQGRPVR